MTSRKDFISTSGQALTGVWLARIAPFLPTLQACAADASRDGAPFTTFTAGEGAAFDAFAARIIPTTDTPGAREAGSVYFADMALGGPLADLLPIIRGGLEAIDARAGEAREGARSFTELTEDEQDGVIGLVEQEDPGFFFFARTLVMLGLVTNPGHGGNRDKAGWRLLGFEDAYRYEPPFGFYDRNEHGDDAGEGADR